MSAVVLRGVGAATWQAWNRPKNAQMVYVLCIGSGAGGAGGLNGTPQGGGSGAITTLLIAATLLPPTLYCLVGLGGAGGISNGAGGNGAISYVSSIAGNTAASALVLASGTAAATNTTGGTAATGALWGYGNMGLWSSFAGLPPSAANSAVVWGGASPTGVPLCGGSSGSSYIASATGFGVTAAGPFPGIPATPAAGVAGTSACFNDPSFAADLLACAGSPVPFMPSGGTGGSCNTLSGATGGSGGPGAIGCGGGGGSGGATVNGLGGRGGDGLILIVAW